VTRQNRGMRRRAHFQKRVDDADTSKGRLSAACQWLMAEAWASEQVPQATDAVLAEVRRIRGEEDR
jgi:hypothetical protein